MFLTKSQAAELAALVPAERVDLLDAIKRCTLQEKSEGPTGPTRETIAVPRTISSYEIDRPTAPIPSETMAELQARGRARTVDL